MTLVFVDGRPNLVAFEYIPAAIASRRLSVIYAAQPANMLRCIFILVIALEAVA